MTSFLMNNLLGGLYLGLFYAFYLLVMRRTTFFRLNRAVLLGGSYLCMLLPLVRLRTVKSARTVVVSSLTMITGEAESAGQVAGKAFPWQEVLLGIYLAGAAAVLVLYLISARKMGRQIRRGRKVERDGCVLVLLDGDCPSFSWGRKVVMSRKDLQENPAIYTHELMHVRCRHSGDLLLFLPVQILFWWNPLVWILRDELRLLHEYEADERVIREGIDAAQYQLLLVRKAVGEQRFTMASCFQHAKLKSRISMMLSPVSSVRMRWAYLAILPVLAAFMFACNPARIEESGPEVIVSHMRKPTFNGGDANEFSKWVTSQLHYPEQAKTDGVQGRVILQYTVEADGVVSNVRVLRGIREDLDAEALRVISMSPKWEPGIRDGKAVSVSYTFPVVFILR